MTIPLQARHTCVSAISYPLGTDAGARDEGKDITGKPVDRGVPVPPGPDKAEDFEGVLFKSVDL